MNIPDILERRLAAKGTIIIREGEAGDSAFLIQSGVVRVYVDHGGKQVELARLWPGQIFGEMALVFDEKRTASVEALEDTNLIVLTRAVIEEKLRKSDPTIRAIAPMLMKRIIQANNVLLNRHANISTLVETTRNVYDIAYAVLPQAQKMAFQNAILPKLDLFLNAIKAFEEKYAEHNKGKP